MPRTGAHSSTRWARCAYSFDKRTDLRADVGRAYVDCIVISPITLTLAGAILLVVAIIALTTRRLKAHSEFELGSVSQQWLVGHKGDEQ